MLNYTKNPQRGQDLMPGKLEQIVTLIANKTNCQPRVNGQNYILRCPAHEDKKPSLSVSAGNNGKVLFKCFSGCTAEAICQSIGIHVKNLFPKKRVN
jgi:hypothetical protein